MSWKASCRSWYSKGRDPSLADEDFNEALHERDEARVGWDGGSRLLTCWGREGVSHNLALIR